MRGDLGVRCQLRPAMPHPGKSVTGEDTQNRLAPKVSELVGPMMWNGTRGNVLAPAGDPQRILTKNPDPSTVALATTAFKSPARRASLNCRPVTPAIMSIMGVTAPSMSRLPVPS